MLNSLGLKLAAIEDESGDPPGGIIDRALPDGVPTGILYGMGEYLAKRSRRLTRGNRAGFGPGGERLLSCGITSVQDASAYNDLRQWRRFEACKIRGVFAPRINMMMGLRGFREWKRKPVYDPVGDGTTQGRGGKDYRR